jgi:predicted PurR-regulated permease PerM
MPFPWCSVCSAVLAFGLVGLFIGPVLLAVLAIWREWLRSISRRSRCQAEA